VLAPRELPAFGVRSDPPHLPGNADADHFDEHYDDADGLDATHDEYADRLYPEVDREHLADRFGHLDRFGDPAVDGHELNPDDLELGRRDDGGVDSGIVRLSERRRGRDRYTLARDGDGLAGELRGERSIPERLADGHRPHAGDGLRERGWCAGDQRLAGRPQPLRERLASGHQPQSRHRDRRSRWSPGEQCLAE